MFSYAQRAFSWRGKNSVTQSEIKLFAHLGMLAYPRAGIRGVFSFQEHSVVAYSAAFFSLEQAG